MKISALLKLLQQNKSHLAVIVDEFGGTEGIVADDAGDLREHVCSHRARARGHVVPVELAELCLERIGREALYEPGEAD